jgi:hypothetical protein
MTVLVTKNEVNDVLRNSCFEQLTAITPTTNKVCKKAISQEAA